MDFYQQTNGNLFRECKECTKVRVRRNRMVKIDYYREFDRRRADLPHRIEARKAYAQTQKGKDALALGSKAWAKRNPIKKAASTAVNNAIRDGRLIRQPCEVCGHEIAQAHHDDYSKPLDVRWLCTTHHAEWHKHNTPLCPDQEQSA